MKPGDLLKLQNRRELTPQWVSTRSNDFKKIGNLNSSDLLLLLSDDFDSGYVLVLSRYGIGFLKSNLVTEQLE